MYLPCTRAGGGAVNPQHVGQAGKMFVAAEIDRRGGCAATFAGNMPWIGILASDLADSRRISTLVMTKRRGDRLAADLSWLERTTSLEVMRVTSWRGAP